MNPVHAARVTDQYAWFVAVYVRYPYLIWTNIWTNPSSPTGGQSATIYCELKNQGTGNTPTTFTNYFYIDGGYDSYGVNSGLAAGAAFDWTFTRTLGPGYHTITTSADLNNNVSARADSCGLPHKQHDNNIFF